MVEEKLLAFKGLYDTYRIVNPKEKLVIVENGRLIEAKTVFCFRTWNKTTQCDNCISMAAYIEKKSSIRLRYVDGKIFLITFIPVDYESDTLVIELIKDISEDKIIYNEGDQEEASIGEFVNQVIDFSTRDSLTGLHNRRFINMKLKRDVRKNIENKKTLSLLMIDIDFFKEINDIYGHIIGDKVLRDFSEILSAIVTQNEAWVARYGGEEFLIAIGNTEEEEARGIAEKIRSSVNNKNFIYGDEIINITCSIGIHTFTEKAFNDLDTIIDAVDKKLYRAKREGRNKIIFD